MMTRFHIAVALAAVVALMVPIDAHEDDLSPGKPAYLLIDAANGRVLDVRWDDLDRPLAMGSLIKPFTALAYADGHRFTYPTITCRGSADGCWLPAGHGRVGIAEAVAGSCNAYFRHLAQRTPPDALVARLQGFGMRADLAAATPAAMVGFGDALKLAPSALVGGYLELASRAGQPGVSPILQGMLASARIGTGRGVGAALGGADALVKPVPRRAVIRGGRQPMATPSSSTRPIVLAWCCWCGHTAGPAPRPRLSRASC